MFPGAERQEPFARVDDVLRGRREGDEKAGDGLWTIRLDLPAGKEIQYKYTNSGEPGQWATGDEAPGRNRKIVIDPGQTVPIFKDTFGKID